MTGMRHASARPVTARPPPGALESAAPMARRPAGSPAGAGFLHAPRATGSAPHGVSQPVQIGNFSRVSRSAFERRSTKMTGLPEFCVERRVTSRM